MTSYGRTMRRLLLLLLFVSPLYAQDLRPSAYYNAAPKNIVTVRGGKVQGSAGVVTLAGQDITPTANATTYVYVDLNSSSPAVTTNTTGFPANNFFPICTVTTDVKGNISGFT